MLVSKTPNPTFAPVPLVASTSLLDAKVSIETSSDDGHSQLYQFIDYRAAASPDHHRKRIPPIARQIIESLTTRKALPGSSKETRSLPTLLLYDNRGLDLFDQITYLPEYYLTTCEIDVLQSNIAQIVDEIPDDSDVIELGCGSLRKTEILLHALNERRTGVNYYAIDVMPAPLHQSMGDLAPQFPNLSMNALCGTYDEVLVHFRKSQRPKTVLWLGSSIGNFHAAEAANFIAGISANALLPGDAIVVGMDKQKDEQIIVDAYHDSQGLTAKFEINALDHANRIFAEYASSCIAGDVSNAQVFDTSKFRYTGEYDKRIGRHDAFIECTENTVVQWPDAVMADVANITGSADANLHIAKGERIYIESSYKYAEDAAEVLAKATGLSHTASWSDKRDYYGLSLFRKPRFSWSLPLMTNGQPLAIESASLGGWSEPARRALDLTHAMQPSTIPSTAEWEQMWAAWDTLSLHIIPADKLLDKPIDLRHPFIFYLGHLPVFADIHMAAAEQAPLTEPRQYAVWFERGIDPNLENPEICHAHSEVPDQWPQVAEILAYRDRVRDRVRSWVTRFHAGELAPVSASAARHVWMAFEHDAMHTETMLYMVLQMTPGSMNPPLKSSFAPLSAMSKSLKPAESWLRFTGGSNITMGLLADNEESLASSTLPDGHIFGWDNESPSTVKFVDSFKVSSHPVTNSQYLEFLLSQPADEFEALVPKSWISLDNDDFGMRTVHGAPSITTTVAALWPVFVSQCQASKYAELKGKRLPTEAEWSYASRTYHMSRALNETASTKASGSLSVDDYLRSRVPPDQLRKALAHPYDAFAPTSANIGFAHWHPVPSVQGYSDGMGGACFVGNGWEWTSTPFRPFEGFKASPMYPGYSADFFDPPETAENDSTHYVVKGGSYATHQRIALRQTFRNWYQRGYPFVLATFRLCDAE